MKTWIPYPSKDGNPIHEKTEENITSINNKEEEKEKNKKENPKQKIVKFYEENITLITQFVSEDIDKYLEDLDADLIIEAMKEAVTRNNRNWHYVTGILNNCINQRIKTVTEFKRSQEEFKEQQKKNKERI